MALPGVLILPGLGLPVQTQVDDELVVRAAVSIVDHIKRRYTFRKGVVATYGPTTVTADELIVDQDAQTGSATGNVSLVDPDGTLTARDLTFSWKLGSRRGHATGVSANFAGVRFSAATADITPTLWTFTDVYGTSSRLSPPLFGARARKVVMIPGRSGQMEHPKLDILGHTVLMLPSQRFNLDPRVEGLRLPALSYRKGVGFGANWESGLLLDEQTAIGAGLASFRGERPSYSLQFARSMVPATSTRSLIVPRSDLSERFAFSFFESVDSTGPGSDQNYVRGKRDSFSVGSYWFQGSANDPSGAEYTKPLEVAYEKGGVFGDVGATGQVRLQSIRRETEPVTTRLELVGSAAPKPFQISQGLQAYLRGDASSVVGPSTSAWLRGSVGVTYQPLQPVTLSGSVYTSAQAGTAQYAIDELPVRSGGSARVDLNAGPTQLSVMWRYGAGLGWYDRQYYVSQIVGCLEPYILYRKSASEYRLGMNIRLGNLVDVITRRTYKRGDATRHVIDGPGRRAR